MSRLVMMVAPMLVSRNVFQNTSRTTIPPLVAEVVVMEATTTMVAMTVEVVVVLPNNCHHHLLMHPNKVKLKFAPKIFLVWCCLKMLFCVSPPTMALW